jgi:hypothetical protein
MPLLGQDRSSIDKIYAVPFSVPRETWTSRAARESHV